MNARRKRKLFFVALAIAFAPPSSASAQDSVGIAEDRVTEAVLDRLGKLEDSLRAVLDTSGITGFASVLWEASAEGVIAEWGEPDSRRPFNDLSSVIFAYDKGRFLRGRPYSRLAPALMVGKRLSPSPQPQEVTVRRFTLPAMVLLLVLASPAHAQQWSAEQLEVWDVIQSQFLKSNESGLLLSPPPT